MNNEATYNKNGVKVTFKKSLRTQMYYFKLRDILAPDDTVWDYPERRQFAWVSGHAITVKGLKWQPPTPADTREHIEAAYQSFMDTIEDYDVFNDMNAIVNQLYAPVADTVQRPNEALTPEEQADPNS